MSYDTKYITFREVSSIYRFSRTLLMNVAFESAHCDCERNSCKDWVWSKICGRETKGLG